MLNKYRNQLAEVRKNAVSTQALYSYVAVLSDLFMKRIDLYIKTCSEFGLREEELIGMLNNASLRHLSLFDEIINKRKETSIARIQLTIEVSFFLLFSSKKLPKSIRCNMVSRSILPLKRVKL